MFKLAFRNIFRNQLRTALTLAAIVCGVAAVIVSGGFVEDVFVQLARIHHPLPPRPCADLFGWSVLEEA